MVLPFVTTGIRLASAGSKAVGKGRKLYNKLSKNPQELAADHGGIIKDYLTTPPEEYLARVKADKVKARNKGYIEKIEKAAEKRKDQEKIELAKKRDKLRADTSRNADKKKGMKAGGSVKKCKRDGIAVRGRTKGRMV